MNDVTKQNGKEILKKVKDKREALLSAALRLFTQNGFHNTPTSKISREAGVATGTLFNYFKNKEDLINQLYLDQKLRINQWLMNGIEEHKTIRNKIKHIWFSASEYILDHPVNYKFMQQFSNSTYLDQMTQNEVDKMHEFLFKLFEEGIKQKIIKNIPLIELLYYSEGILTHTIKYLLENNTARKEYKIQVTLKTKEEFHNQ